MKKELVWAIIIGFSVGLVITWGIWRARRAVQPEPEEAAPIETTPTPTPPPITLNVESPQEGAIVDQSPTTLAGKSDPEAIITIFTEEKELIILADKEGQFETEIDLIEGANKITVIAFDEEGHEASQSMNIVYSTAEL